MFHCAFFSFCAGLEAMARSQARTRRPMIKDITTMTAMYPMTVTRRVGSC